jgi:hypothetical protein
MAGFLLDSGTPDYGRRKSTVRTGVPPSSRRKRTTKKPRKWLPNMLPQVQGECGHWMEAWPEIRAFPRGFIKCYCDICGDWSQVVDTSKIPEPDDIAEPLF